MMLLLLTLNFALKKKHFDFFVGQADALVSRPDNFKDVCAAIDAKLRCLESNVGKCLNDQGKQNIRSISNISNKLSMDNFV